MKAKRDPLTPREREVLRSISRGKTDKEIAVELGITENTVTTHVRSILKRLKSKSRAQAAVRWVSCCL